MIENDLSKAKKSMMKTYPTGITPLARHVREIRENIKSMLPNLTSQSKRVAVILATDGLPTDDYGMTGAKERREFIEAVKTLEGLPIWIVIRLCTDDDEVVNFYNDIDSQLELSIEVLDDFEAEAKEVYEHNKWLNYTLALHRCREMGYYHRLFDLLDERLLTKGELREFCYILFGSDAFDSVPDAEADWEGFLKAISNIVENEKEQWNPMKKSPQKLIDLKVLSMVYNPTPICCTVS